MNFRKTSPLRYPGGKSCLTSHFIEIVRLNKIYNITYIEPFAGGAGAALNLLFLEYMDNIWINDADENIYSFWYSILNHTEEFIKKIENCSVNMHTWRLSKEIINNNHASIIEKGFATFFLNRCNHSGVINGGPIGGINQTGKWKIDARFNKSVLINRIDKISEYRERIKVTNNDALDLLKNLDNIDCFLYLDPPYYVKGQDLYLNYYKHHNHVELSKNIKKLKQNWILSYDHNKNIIDLYTEKRMKKYNLNYSVNKVRKGSEILIYSDGLELPQAV